MPSDDMNPSPTSKADADRMQFRIRAAQIRQLYAQTLPGLIAVSIAAAIVSFSLRDHVPHRYLILWLGGFLALQIPRHILTRRFSLQTRDDDSTAQWGTWFTLGTVLSGLMWGLMGFFFPPFLPPLHQFFLAMSVAGIASAAAVVYAPLVGCYAPTLIVVLAPLALRFMLMGGDFFVTIAAVIVLFGGVLILTTQTMNHAYVESLRLRFDNGDLIDSLTEEKAKADRLNLSLFREIEERKRAEHAARVERDRLQTFLEHSPVGMVMLSSAGLFLHVNPKFTELFGYELSDIPNGRTWCLLAYPDPAYRKGVIATWKQDLREQQPGEVRLRAFTVVCKDGTQKTVEFKSVQIASGEHLMACEDVTEHRRAQKILQESHIELEQRVSQRTAQLSRANEVLEQEIRVRRKTEEALRESEERYRLLAQHSLTGIYIHQNNLFCYVNDTLAEMMGLSPTEMIGKPFWEFVHPEDREMVKTRGMARARGEAVVSNYEFRLLRTDGSTIWVELLAAAIPYGGLTANMGNVADVTERKRAEEALRRAHEELEMRVAERTAQLRQTNEELKFEVAQRTKAEEDLKQSEKKFRSLFESAPDIIHILSTDGVILQTNPAATGILGFPEQHLVGKRTADFLTAVSRARFEAGLVVLSVTGTCREELDMVCKEGITKSLDCSASAIRDEHGRLSSFVVYLRDVTEKKRALFVAEEAAKELERALANATRLRVQADAANRAKSEFLATMSHELRTPLNAIIGFSEILQDRTFGQMNEKQLQFIGYVLDGGRHLLRLINDILDLAKIESGKTELQLASVKLGKFLRTSIITVKERAKDQRLNLEVRIEEKLSTARILADEVKLRQVLFNLLSNAVKFTPDDGRVFLEVRKVREEIVFSVSDSGIGLTQDNYERIFGAFEQVDSTLARRQQGTGLGLALTRRLVQLQGGSIWVESAGLGKGSTFTFTIPWVESQFNPSAGPDPLAAGDGDSEDELQDSWVSFRTLRSSE
jgi:PAS domain S-box-containing protein